MDRPLASKKHMNNTNKTTRLTYWGMKIQEMNMNLTVKYREDKANANADVMSKLPGEVDMINYG